MNEDALRAAARAAYERGRLRRALTTGTFVVAPVLLSVQTWGLRSFALWAGLVGYVAFVAATWRGQRAAMGAFVGLVAGSIPLILLALTRSAEPRQPHVTTHPAVETVNLDAGAGIN